MAGLQYKNQVDIVAGGYAGEWKGSDGIHQNWTDVTGTSGSMTARYYYHDSWLARNDISSRVWVTITDNWEIIEQTDNNHIKLRVTSSVDRIERVASGTGSEGSWNCIGQSWPGKWHIQIFTNRDKSGGVVPGGDFQNLVATVNQVISSTPVSLGTFTIDLPPQTELSPTSRGTVFYQSGVMGHEWDPDTSTYVDRMWMGINFRNTLPPDYRVGKTIDNNGIWQSHNRTTGKADIRTNSTWQTMRTNGGPTSQGNPPLIRQSSAWYNMRKIGNNAQ